jgi:hypothetical protein
MRRARDPLTLFVLLMALGGIVVGSLLVARIPAGHRVLGIVFIVGGVMSIYTVFLLIRSTRRR